MRYKVFITPHALKQWRRRVRPYTNPETIARWVAARLRIQMALGIVFNERRASELTLRPGLTAVVALNKKGPGWAVLTFTIDPEKLKLPG